MGLLIQSQGAKAYFTPVQDNTESNDFIQKGFMNEAIVELFPILVGAVTLGKEGMDSSVSTVNL